MSSFRQLSLAEAYPFYKDLYEETKRSYTSFNGMDFFNLKLFKGDFLLLKNRFKLTPYGLFDNKKPRILLTHYQAISPELGSPNSLGAILVATDITESEINEFCQELRKAMSSITGEIVFPLNAHFNLGFSVPAEDHDPKAITFLTSAGNSSIRNLINALGGKKKRTFHSLSTNIVKDPASLKKVTESIKTRPAGFTVEQLSVVNYKKDIQDYNRIINGSFKDHYAFYPLTFLEEWDLMKTALLVINRNYFRFLSFQGERVAVSMFFPDYNTVLKNGEDVQNTFRIFNHKSSISRVRGVNVAILPEYRGQGLIKYVRNENLLKMIADGVSVIESSYIDQDNVNSIENVKSTGAQASHTFDLYSLN